MHQFSTNCLLKVIAENHLLLLVCQVAEQHPAQEDPGVIESLVGTENEAVQGRQLHQFFQPDLGIKSME